MEDDSNISEEDSNISEEDSKSDENPVNTPDPVTRMSPFTSTDSSTTFTATTSTTSTTTDIPEPSAMSLEEETKSDVGVGTSNVENQNREDIGVEEAIPHIATSENKDGVHLVPSVSKKEENRKEVLPPIVPSEGKEEEEAIPLIIPSQLPSSSVLLCMEDEDEENIEIGDTPLFSLSAAPHLLEVTSSSPTIMRDSEESGPAIAPKEIRHFRPLIEVMTSTEAEEEEEETSTSEATVSSSKLHAVSLSSVLKKPSSHTKKRKVSFSLSDPEKHADEEQAEEVEEKVEEGWDRKNASTGDRQQQWATLVTHSELQASKVNEGKDDRLVVEDLQHEIEIPPLEVSNPDSEEQKGIEQDFKLSDVPIVSDATVEHVDAIFKALEGKEEDEMSREERVWKLAASGGSTLQEDAVTLDPQTKARVKQGLQKANLLDQVSLKF